MRQPTSTPAWKRTHEHSLQQQQTCHQHILSTKNTAQAQGCSSEKSCQEFTACILWRNKQKRQKKQNKSAIYALTFLKTIQRDVLCFLSLFVVEVTLGQIWNDLLVITALTVVYYGWIAITHGNFFFNLLWQVLKVVITSLCFQECGTARSWLF